VWRHDEQERCDDHYGTVARWKPRPVYDVCRCTNAPATDDQIQKGKRQECPRRHQDDEELRCAANQCEQEYCSNQGEEWCSEEGRLSTVATEPVSGARKHRSEQGGANE
jgi:hypothetical protein